MENRKDQTSFAFKLVKNAENDGAAPARSEGNWRAREGVSIAGCTFKPGTYGDEREAFPWGDGRAYC